MTTEQEKILRLLDLFSALCEKYQLRYFLAGGTLLGAIRHQGFIPWDDDADVMMPAADYEAFLRLQRELPPGIVLQSPSADPRYPFVFSKLCDTTAEFTQRRQAPPGTYIDIFPLKGARAPSRGTFLLFDAQLLLTNLLQEKLGWQEYQPYKMQCASVLHGLFGFLPWRVLLRCRNWLLSLLESDCTAYNYSPGGTYRAEKEFYPKSWFEAAEQGIFESRTFPIPRGWEQYLIRNYGKYWEFPPERERVPRHHSQRGSAR